MKICFLGLENLPVLAPQYEHHPIGGAQVQQTLLARALARLGHDVAMVVADYGQSDGSVWHGIRTFKAYALEAGVPVLRFVYPRSTGVWAALRRADADLYYTSCAGAELGLLAAFCRRHGKRFVFRVASDSDCDPAELLVRYARDRWLYGFGLRRADAILVQSEHQQRLLAHHYGLRSRRTRSIVEPAEDPPARRDIDVLWVNNVRPIKRPDLMLELAAMLPDKTVHLIGGPVRGEEDSYRAAERRATELPNVVFHGRLPYAATNDCYRRARLLVSTSDVEGFPNAYLQSWIRGVPVVSRFDPDGIIERERLGYAAQSLEDLRAAVLGLLGDAAAWATASERCRAFMARHFGEAGIIAPYIETFESLAGSPAGRMARIGA